MSILRQFLSFKPLHGFERPLESFSEFISALDSWQNYGDFEKSIYRGEPQLYDVDNTGTDTYLISKIGRDPVISGNPLKSYTRNTNRDFSGLNISVEELDEIDKCQKDHEDIPLSKYSTSWVAYAQHYGYKTRLLDFSTNPLVGLFFACWQTTNFTDGVVYLVIPKSLRPQTTSRDSVEPGDIEQGIPDSYFEVFEPWSLSPIHDQIPHQFIPKGRDYEINKRLNAQTGLFVWWNTPDTRLPSNIFPIVISKDAKKQILKELKPLGIRPDRLFPDESGANYQKELDDILKK